MIIWIIATLIVSASAQWDPHFAPGHSTIVHLFEWKWSEIALECERFLGPQGFGGIQVSPPNENVIVQQPGNRPWWERYQPISYKLITRSGDEAAFADMVRRCNNVGVRIYPDIIINHMARDPKSGQGTGTGGSLGNPGLRDFPAVPFTSLDFNPSCHITDWNNAYEVRNCELEELPDLNQANPWVRDRIVDFLNHLIDLGVAGFRVDAAKHMWPGDLEIIFNRLHNLNTAHGFAPNSRAFMAQEVIDRSGSEPIRSSHYTHLGTVTEFRFSDYMARQFGDHDALAWLRNFGEGWNMLPSRDALVFVDNHDNQRDHALTYKDPRPYKMAIAFGAAYPYGQLRVMSSFAFDYRDQGPPADANGNPIPPSINEDNTCGNGWVCEHRWRQIYHMVKFRNLCWGTSLQNWWDNGQNKIAFGRGNCGFIAFNNQLNTDFLEVLQTGLPAGVYCDIISGDKLNHACTGRSFTVLADGRASIHIPYNGEDGMVAFHIESRL
ncbi:alpha-amylase A-like [Uranotaenia lowii]|uniref:alpha-amylase A-like n=1 Tax=Uranotaenia lowii TaxID=190385 RepID=UPI00247905DB|nr:alpha-amylase A-like [Uranotaenia lowii]XP_055597408.1 alpha-amylase A-like [Uranotaenia lowii]